MLSQTEVKSSLGVELGGMQSPLPQIFSPCIGGISPWFAYEWGSVGGKHPWKYPFQGDMEEWHGAMDTLEVWEDSQPCVKTRENLQDSTTLLAKSFPLVLKNYTTLRSRG